MTEKIRCPVDMTDDCDVWDGTHKIVSRCINCPINKNWAGENMIGRYKNGKKLQTTSRDDYEIYLVVEPLMRAIEERTSYHFKHETLPELGEEHAYIPTHKQIIAGINEVAAELREYIDTPKGEAI